MRTTPIRQLTATRLHGKFLAQRKTHPVWQSGCTIKNLLSVDGKVERTTRGNRRHVDDVILYDPFIAGLRWLIFACLALAQIGPVAIAVAIEPDVKVHRVARRRQCFADAHVKRLALAIEELDRAIAPAVVPAIIVGYVTDYTSGVAQNVVGTILIRAQISLRFAGEEVTQPAFHALVVMARPRRLAGWHITHRGELSQHTTNCIGRIILAVVIATVWRIAQIRARAFIGWDGVSNDEFGHLVDIGLCRKEALQWTIATQRKAIIGGGISLPLGNERRNIPTDHARGVAYRLNWAAKSAGRFRVPGYGVFIPGAFIAPQFNIGGRCVSAGKVELQFGAVDRGVNRQRHQIKLDEGQVTIG